MVSCKKLGNAPEKGYAFGSKTQLSHFKIMEKTMPRSAPIALAAALLLAACSNSNQAGDAQFKKAINQYAEQNGVCLPLALTVQSPHDGGAQINVLLGAPQILIAEQDFNGGRINQNMLAQMRVLDKEGFYKRSGSENLPLPDGKGKIKISAYELTEKGSAQSRPGARGPLFCIGRLSVEKINWYTEPTPANGMTLSKVSYQAEFKPEKWAEKLLEKGGEQWPQIDSTRTQTATLVQTNQGWRDIRELQ